MFTVWYHCGMLLRPELLSPAGDWECARAAVANGADAVYFGLTRFNARLRARNFTEDDLPELMGYLHRHGVRGFVTFNTLVFTDELPEAEKELRLLAGAGVDAIIVQDLGLARLAQAVAPELEVHASTQMTVHDASGAQLPLPTRIVIALSNFIASFWWLIGIIIGGGIYAVRRYHETYKGRRVIDGLMLRIPIIGILLRKIAVARFCRTLSTLTSSGVPILDGLTITARTAGNAIIEDAIMATRKSVEEGKTISEPLGDTDVFPSMVVQMIAVGEQTGALDTMLSKIADFYEDEVDTAVAGLMKLLEPVLIAFLGVAIGGIVIAMYLPMFSLISQIG